MGSLERLTGTNVDETLAYLARRPFDNVYVHWLVASRQIGRGSDVAVWRDDARRVAGACYLGAQLVPCVDAGMTAALEAFGEQARLARSVRMIVGPRDAVERLWAGVADAYPAPSATRTSQPVYAVERRGMRPQAGLDVARATLDELDEIVPNSAEMIAGEVGGDPRRAGTEFRMRTARIIDRGWWWRARVDGRLAFMCNVGSASPYTAQIQGVWTPPAMRGKGFATLALTAICAALLDEHHTLCLYVNDFNASAIALYERVGFERVGEFQTILLP
jgi:ribosomal protein S18 acetylase RimI-like enzyme